MTKSPYCVTGIALAGLAGLNTAIAEITLDGSTGSSGPIDLDTTTKTYIIDESVGQLSSNGNNLFHSFDTFNVYTGETALFTGAPRIENIIGRVTGNSRSDIYGTLKSDITGANLYLINPNGIVFGAEASIDLTGSFYASTADNISFENGEQLTTKIDQAPVFSSAAPTAFGFLDNNVGAITIDGSQLQVGAGESINLIGGNITIDNGAYISAEAGLIRVASVGDAKTVTLTNDGLEFKYLEHAGDIALSDLSQLDVSGAGAGRVVIRGGNLELDQSNILATSYGDFAETQSTNIDIRVSDSVQLDHESNIENDVYYSVAASAGGITINSRSVNLNNHSGIGSEVLYGASGDGGDIDIYAEDITVNSGSYIYTSNSGNGIGGDIHIEADKLNIDGTYEVMTNYFGMLIPSYESSAVTVAGADNSDVPGQSGDLYILTADITLTNGGKLSMSTLGQADLGSMFLSADKISISGSNQELKDWSLAFGLTQAEAEQAAGSAIFYSNAYLNDSNIGNSTNGSINLNTSYLRITQGGYISTQSAGDRDSGNINIRTSDLTLASGGYINTDNSSGRGNAGAIHINAENIGIDGKNSGSVNSGIYSITSNSSGQGGDINVVSTNLLLDNGGRITSNTHSNGNGGNISIYGKKSIILDNSSSISAKSVGDLSGNAGNIQLNTSLLAIINSDVNTSAVFGNGGNINITAQNIVIDDSSQIDAASELGIAGEININKNTNASHSLSKMNEDTKQESLTVSHNCNDARNRNSLYIAPQYQNIGISSAIPSTANVSIHDSYPNNLSNRRTLYEVHLSPVICNS